MFLKGAVEIVDVVIGCALDVFRKFVMDVENGCGIVIGDGCHIDSICVCCNALYYH